MEMKEVKSTQIHSLGFDPATGTLAIRFHGKEGLGSLYHYPNFTEAKFKEFCECESKGKYFGTNIRGNKDHPHRRIDETK